MNRSYPRVYFELLLLGFSVILGMGLSRAFLPILSSQLDPTHLLVGFATSGWFFARLLIELPSGIISERVLVSSSDWVAAFGIRKLYICDKLKMQAKLA